MGLFAKTQSAKPAAGANYAKPGCYWVLFNYVKHDKHQVKGQEFVAFEGVVLTVLDNAEGKGPKPGEPVSFVFMDGILGNEARLKSFVMTAMSCTEAEVTEESLKQLVDPVVQPMRDVVVEIFATPQRTRAQKDIVASRAVRRVWAEEVKTAFEGMGSAAQAVLSSDGRLDKMVEREKTERD